jgi:hypothetical protein
MRADNGICLDAPVTKARPPGAEGPVLRRQLQIFNTGTQEQAFNESNVVAIMRITDLKA